MIEARFFKNDSSLLTGFELSGHAGFEDVGLDIVCSAVTSNAIAVINSLDELVGVKFKELKAEEGHIKCIVDDSYIEASQLLLKHLRLALNEIGREFQDNIKILGAGGDSEC